MANSISKEQTLFMTSKKWDSPTKVRLNMWHKRGNPGMRLSDALTSIGFKTMQR